MSESRFDQNATYTVELHDGGTLKLRYMNDRQRVPFIKGQGLAVFRQGYRLFQQLPALDWAEYERYIANLVQVVSGLAVGKETKEALGRFSDAEYWGDACMLGFEVWQHEHTAQYGDEEAEATDIPQAGEVDNLPDSEVERLGES